MDNTTTAAAERVRRYYGGTHIVKVYHAKTTGGAGARFQADLRTLADAYLAQQPTYEQQAAEIEAAWKMIESEYDIEPRAQIEAEAKTNGFQFGLAQAVHTIWKRDAKVMELAAEIAELRAALNLQKQVASESIDAYAKASEQLTELRAAAQAFDDERPVDGEWLKANGFTFHTGLGTWRRELPSLRVLEINLSPYDPGIYFAQDKAGAPVHVVRTTKEVPSIGQLRHLLAALGGAK